VGRGTNGNFKGGKGEDCVGIEVLCVSNGYLFDSENTGTSDRYTTGLVVQLQTSESFTNRFAFGWDYFQVESEEWEPWGYLRAPGGYYSSDGQSRSKLSLDYAGSFRNMFGEDYVPPPHIQADYKMLRNHSWYMEPRLVTVNDLYAFEEGVTLSIDPFREIIGRNFKMPKEGLGNDNSPVAHMWRSIARPDSPL